MKNLQYKHKPLIIVALFLLLLFSIEPKVDLNDEKNIENPGNSIKIDFQEFINNYENIKDIKIQNESKSNTVYKTHFTSLPIKIDGNGDFSFQASINGWTGNGTYLNPIIIENLIIETNISSPSAISIENTNYYFIIRNNSLVTPGSSSSGLFLKNVSNGYITNNTANSGRYGFNLESSNNNSLVNNTANSNGEIGIFLEKSSNNNTIKNNTVNYNSKGISLINSHNNTFNNNIVNNNSNYGFSLKYSKNNSFYNNSANNNFYGFDFVDLSISNFLSNNMIENNIFGITLASDNNVLINNLVHDNSLGVLLFFSLNNTLVNNIFDKNEMGLQIISSSQNSLISNSFYNGGIIFDCFSLSDCVQEQVKDNKMNGLPLVFLQHATNQSVLGRTGQIILVNSSLITIKNQIITNSSTGIQLIFSGNNFLVNNTANFNSNYGIYLRYSNDNILINNTANFNMRDGFLLIDSNLNNITNNTASNNIGSGFNIQYSNTNLLKLNTANNNINFGYFLANSASLNKLIENNAVYNGVSGNNIIEILTNETLNSITIFYEVPLKGTTIIYIDNEANTTVIESGSLLNNMKKGLHNVTIVTNDEMGNINIKSLIFVTDIDLIFSSDIDFSSTSSLSTSNSALRSNSRPAPIKTSPGFSLFLISIAIIFLVIRRKK